MMLEAMDDALAASVSSELLRRCWPVVRNCFDEQDGVWSPRVERSATGADSPFAYRTPGGCVIAADVMELFHRAGLAGARFYERVHTCPRCEGADVLFREVCPSCGSAGLERPELIHHFTCAGVYAKEMFGSPDDLRCPKCQLELKYIGVDHEYLHGEFHCVACDEVSSVVPTAGRCLLCESRFPAEQAGVRDWFEYERREDQPPLELAPKPMENALLALAGVGEERNRHIGSHLQRMRQYCSLLTHALLDRGYAEPSVALTPQWCEETADAALLHDVGNVALREALLLKPGAYTQDEREAMTRHVDYGSLWLEETMNEYGATNVLRRAQQIIRYHHEQWDGSGYGAGLVGRDIPLEARVVKVADVYDAMRSARSYREGWPHAKAVEAIAEQSSRTLDPDIVEAFRAHQSEFARVFAELR